MFSTETTIDRDCGCWGPDRHAPSELDIGKGFSSIEMMSQSFQMKLRMNVSIDNELCRINQCLQVSKRCTRSATNGMKLTALVDATTGQISYTVYYYSDCGSCDIIHLFLDVIQS